MKKCSNKWFRKCNGLFQNG